MGLWPDITEHYSSPLGIGELRHQLQKHTSSSDSWTDILEPRPAFFEGSVTENSFTLRHLNSRGRATPVLIIGEMNEADSSIGSCLQLRQRMHAAQLGFALLWLLLAGAFAGGAGISWFLLGGVNALLLIFILAMLLVPVAQLALFWRAVRQNRRFLMKLLALKNCSLA